MKTEWIIIVKNKCLLFLLLTIFVQGSSIAGESYWEYRDWKTEPFSSDKYLYTTNGQVDNENQFGFWLDKNNCSRNVLWLTTSRYEYNEPYVGNYKVSMSEYDGKDFKLAVKVDNKKTFIIAPLVTTFKFPPEFGMVTALFSNAIASEEFIQDLKKGSSVSFTITQLGQTTSDLDIETETFSLSGFAAHHLKATEACKGVDKELVKTTSLTISDSKKVITPTGAFIPLIELDFIESIYNDQSIFSTNCSSSPETCQDENLIILRNTLDNQISNILKVKWVDKKSFLMKNFKIKQQVESCRGFVPCRLALLIEQIGYNSIYIDYEGKIPEAGCAFNDIGIYECTIIDYPHIDKFTICGTPSSLFELREADAGYELHYWEDSYLRDGPSLVLNNGRGHFSGTKSCMHLHYSFDYKGNTITWSEPTGCPEVSRYVPLQVMASISCYPGEGNVCQIESGDCILKKDAETAGSLYYQ